MTAMSSQPAELNPIKRPNPGAIGQKLQLQSNFMRVLQHQKRQTVIAQYAVRISPEIPTALNRRVFQQVMQDPELKSKRAVFDGMAIAYSVSPLPENKDFTVFTTTNARLCCHLMSREGPADCSQ